MTINNREIINEDVTTITRIQSHIRAFNSRKKTNIYGESEGKEIEVYIPFALKKIQQNKNIFDYEMIGNSKTTICESYYFDITIDYMRFKDQPYLLSIPEIVTIPFRRQGETNSNLVREEEIDNAISKFLTSLEMSIAESQGKACFISLNDIIEHCNQINPNHHLRVPTELKKYMANPGRMWGNQWRPSNKHQNAEIGFYYDPSSYPIFDKNDTPRTPSAKSIVNNTDYQKGNLIIHVQKTFSLSVENYKPTFFSNPMHKKFHFTNQQLEIIKIARDRSENFIKEHPLPETASEEKILGLLTIAAEHVLTVTRAKQYDGLHEKADRPLLSIRHILHYVKTNICNTAELEWFSDMYSNNYEDIKRIICVEPYEPDFRSKDGGYGYEYDSKSKFVRYDVIFDLFGFYYNGAELSIKDPYYHKLKENGITSWESLFDNHMFLSGRSHFILQTIINENGETKRNPLFEARRIGIMTISEFCHGESRITFSQDDEYYTMRDKMNPNL